LETHLHEYDATRLVDDILLRVGLAQSGEPRLLLHQQAVLLLLLLRLHLYESLQSLCRMWGYELCM